MAKGLILDFTYLNANTQETISVTDGFVTLINAVGGPMYPGKAWCVYIGYFNSKNDAATDTLNPLPYEDDSPGNVYFQAVFPYVAGVDPYITALAYLKTLYPAGVEADFTPYS